MKKAITLFLAIALVFSLAACGSAKQEPAPTSAPAPAPAAEPQKEETPAKAEEPAEAAEPNPFTESYTWALSTTYATGTPVSDAAVLFGEKLAEYSNGTITLNVFADGSFAGERESFLAINANELEFAAFGPTPITAYTPEYGYILAPFLLQSWEEYQTVFNSDVFQEAKRIWREEYNVRDVAGLAFRGWRHLSSTNPINTIEDLRGVKLRLPDNALWVAAWKALGATPVTIALGELYTALQTGAATASDGPWEQMASIHLNEVQDYVIETNHYPEVAGLWMNETLYQSLSDEYKAVVDKAGAEAMAYMHEECAKRDNAYLQQLLDGGCELIKMDTDGLLGVLQPVYDEYFTKEWTVTTQEELFALLGR